jgi:hypothetical protein
VTAPPRFHGEVHALAPAIRERMTGVSWRPGCPVALDDLRLLGLRHWGFDGRVHRGELVVHADHAEAVVQAFRSLFEARFPVEQLRLVDDFDADDDASMTANNTSGFNCRGVDGTATWSQHAYGLAIDLNPRLNPYITARGEVLPPEARPYLDRSRVEPGMIHPDGPAVRAFAAIGWTWGGAWAPPRDYHHFSATGR